MSKENVPEVPTEVLEDLAEAVLKISKAMEQINKGPLKRELIVTLIHDKSRINKNTIEIVLNNLDQLGAIWLKKAGK